MAGLELSFKDISIAQALFGERDQNLKQLEKDLDVQIASRGNQLHIEGEPHLMTLAESLLKQLYELVKGGYPVYPTDVSTAVSMLSSDANLRLRDIFMDSVYVSSSKKVIVPKTANQKHYVDALRTHDLVFGVGPAGTGKTYLAMALALASFTKKQVRRIILTRPAVEAGEHLGFLPGDLQDKVNPYLRPLYDALYDMVDMERGANLLESGAIEVAPLAFMRGRTLNDAFVILDEAQNTTVPQMKMFLTRLGFNSKAVVTGDITQTDLPDARRSGLQHALRILSKIDDIAITRFTEVDVVRHPLVQKIILAYDRDASHKQPRKKASR